VYATGGRSVNVGLMRVAVRVESGRWWLLVAAKSSPGAPGTCALGVYDGPKPLAQKNGFLPPGTTAETVLPMDGPPPSRLTVELKVLSGQEALPPDDGFPSDDSAYLTLRPASGLRVALVGSPEAALRRALAAREGTTVLEIAPGARLPQGEADLVIATAAVVPPEWTGPAAVIGPTESVGPLRPLDGEVAADWRVAADHPLAGALYLEPPRLGAVRRYEVDAAAQILLGTRETPLMATWQDGGVWRLAVLFQLDEKITDWPHRAGFPVFWSHAVDWLVPAERRPADFVTYAPLAPIPGDARAPANVGFHGDPPVGVSFIGTDEGFQAGPARDDSRAAATALRAAAEGRLREAHADLWPWLAAATMLVLVARAWIAR
jgi:hypothetical protein